MDQALEYFGTLSGLLYLYLEIKQHRTMWIVGFLTSFVYVIVFFHAKIYADMSLQIYYVAMSLYGFWRWGLKITDEGEKAILYRHVSLSLLAGILLAIGVLYIGIYLVLSRYTDSPIPSGDAFTTAGGIVATWMLARRIIEHWIFWIVINLVCMYLYFIRGLYPTMFLYLCYALLPIAGYCTWKKKGIRKDDSTL